jgi:hypothetical protein
LAQCELLTKNLNRNEMTKAEEIYHRFVQYEWNEIGEGMKKSILDAINEALRQPPVSGLLGFDEGYKKGWTDATSQAINEIQKNYKPNDR